MSKKLFVGADHAGVELKRILSEAAEGYGYEVVDVGTHTLNSVDYPDFAHKVASSVLKEGELGLLVCGTGLGMAMAANRHPGIRAASVTDVHSAQMARRHNDANVLCIGARVVKTTDAVDLLDAFLSSTFEHGRHQRRVEKIERL